MKFDEIKNFRAKYELKIEFKNNDDAKEAIDKVVRFIQLNSENFFLDYKNLKLILKDYNSKLKIEELVNDSSRNYIARVMDLETIEVLEFKEIREGRFETNEGEYDFPILYTGEKNRSRRLEEEYLLKIDKNKSFMVLGKNKNDEFILIGRKNIRALETKETEYFYLDEKKEPRKGFGDVFAVSKTIKERDIDFDEYRIVGYLGKIAFLNNSEKIVKSLNSSLMRKELKDKEGTYLKVWNEYMQEEREAEERNAEAFKNIKIKYANRKKDIVELDVDTKLDLSDVGHITISDSPEENEDTENKLRSIQVEEYYKEEKILKIKYVESLGDVKDLKGKYFSSSIGINKVKSDRRDLARKRIENGDSAMKDLLLVIEGKQPNSKKSKFLSLSDETMKKTFPDKNKQPTENQKRAIELALNTPDIAIIQGPPGTGKTTVISAINNQLQQEIGYIGGIKYKILLTSDQHDATTNVLSKIENTGGLPVEKYGVRAGEEQKILDENIERVIADVLKSYGNERLHLERRKNEKILQETFEQFLVNKNGIFTRDNFNNLLRTLDNFIISNNVEDENIIEELEDIQRSVRRMSSLKNINESCFYKLPTCKEEYEDGGKEIIEDSIIELEETPYGEELQKELNLLKKINSKKEINEKLFEIIKICKIRILSNLRPLGNNIILNLPNKRIENLFEKLWESINELNLSNPSEKENIKIRYLDELENNPIRVKETFRSYSKSVGSTCQQSQLKVLREAKGVNFNKKTKNGLALDDEDKYNYVIVDEAARVSPPDLLIPMSLAKQGIILVGDQKQLPHIIDRDIVEILMKKDEESKETEKNVTEYTKDKIVEVSMFQFLMDSCKKLTKEDGIQRVIMLDTQYRMHPTMGTFVSKCFYDGELKNGLPKECFKTKLKGYEGKACAFLDIPYSADRKEQKNQKTKSMYRNIEAKAIAKFLYEHIDEEETKDQNFGVITFYSEQREEILRELANEENKKDKSQESIVIKTKEGFKINSNYSEDFEKIKIGSVDSFQGMEFNYVLLSMVRSNDWKLEDQKDVRRKFGFLTNPNRLCVAMSRQKQLLIMFGDSKMLRGNAEDFEKFEDLKPLVEFLNLCEKGEDGHYEVIL